MSDTLSITESVVFTALRLVLGTYGLVCDGDIPIVRGQVNRVPEPKESDYIVMWPLFRNRLGTNREICTDTQFHGLIQNNVLSVTSIILGEIFAGLPVYCHDGTTCRVSHQISGEAGGVGSYCVSTVVDKPSQIIYGGSRQVLQSTDWVVQCDVHGPNSGDNVQRISALWYDGYTVFQFAELGVNIAPLYADDPKQIPFINAEEQYENRWCISLHAQLNPIVAVTQQFADQLKPTVIDVSTLN